MSLQIKSPVFGNGQFILRKYTCDGDNLNPPPEFLYIPARTKSPAPMGGKMLSYEWPFSVGYLVARLP